MTTGMSSELNFADHFADQCSYCMSHVYFFLFEGFLPKAKPPINVVGDVGGKIAIIIVSVK